MTIGANFDDKIHANLCAAIKSLSPENKFAFAPFLSAEEHNFMGEAIVHNEYSNDVLGSITGLLTGNDSQYKTHLDELAKSFDSKENSGHDATSATASLIMNLTHKVISQISECLDIPINKLTKAYVMVSENDECMDHYEFHRDVFLTESVRLTLALKGKNTAFATDQSAITGLEDPYVTFPGSSSLLHGGSIVSTPDLHLALFTKTEDANGNSGTIHSAPKYEAGEDCSRVLVLIDIPTADNMEL